ncbi:MAG: methyltransferase domain-containing protein [Actinomycetota bacterium]
MKLALVDLLRCPTCSCSALAAHPLEAEDGRCRQGVLVCRQCSAWYPIWDFVLDLLPEGRGQPGSRAEFFARNRPRLEPLGLRHPAAGPVALDADFTAQVQQRAHFDDLARRDDEFSYRALGQLPFQRALRDITFDAWRPLIRSGSLVLDVGCADGLSTFDVAHPGIEVLAFDISPELVAQAAARADEVQMRNVSFFVGDADAIPLAAATVDCVLCYGSLHHVPDPARTLGEATRVLREGGLYLGVENNRTPLRPAFDLLMRLSPIWREEAGAQAQIGAAELRRWTAGSDLRLRTRSIVFVPPHLCNRLGVPAARHLLRWTDSIVGRLPLLRNWGGLISILGRKGAPA